MVRPRLGLVSKLEEPEARKYAILKAPPAGIEPATNGLGMYGLSDSPCAWMLFSPTLSAVECVSSNGFCVAKGFRKCGLGDNALVPISWLVPPFKWGNGSEVGSDGIELATGSQRRSILATAAASCSMSRAV